MPAPPGVSRHIGIGRHRKDGSVKTERLRQLAAESSVRLSVLALAAPNVDPLAMDVRCLAICTLDRSRIGVALSSRIAQWMTSLVVEVVLRYEVGASIHHDHLLARSGGVAYRSGGVSTLFKVWVWNEVSDYVALIVYFPCANNCVRGHALLFTVGTTNLVHPAARVSLCFGDSACRWRSIYG
jgi:hypothetical protein